MPSEKKYNEAFVWIWLPGETAPVVAGKLSVDDGTLVFNYGKSYLDRSDKIAIYDKELPLQPGILPLLPGLNMPNSIRDGSPDAWGRRVIINSKFGAKGKALDDVQLDELTFLLESGSDRVGALDFQVSSSEYQPRNPKSVSLDELLEAAALVEKGVPLTPELDLALHHGTAIGGARPKALIEGDNKKYIAKFSSSTDIYSVVKAEFLAMTLAKITGLHVASVSLKKGSGKDVLQIERFDRVHSKEGWQRKAMISSLTLFELGEMTGHYASYEQLAELIRYRFKDASNTLRELFSRLTFNVLVSNTDDHARNHAAFWDGQMLSLTPAYDICPQSRSGTEVNQAMFIMGSDKRSQIATCLDAAGNFHLSRKDASAIVENQIKAIVDNWSSVCDFSEVSEIDRKLFASRQFLNPWIFERLGSAEKGILDLAKAFRRD